MRLAQVRQVASPTLVLAGGVKRETLTIDPKRDRLGDERRLAPLGGHPAHDRVVLGQAHPHIGVAERRQGSNTGPNRVGELAPWSAARRPRVARRRSGEIDPVGEQRIELLAYLPLDPLRVSLPAGNSLQTGGTLERKRLGEAAVDAPAAPRRS